ncbi:MAG: OmpA family protein [Marinoscillum sp.]
MPRVALSLVLAFIFITSFGQASDSYVKVFGKVLNKKDSSAVSAPILYEKLPYYDDMGMNKSNSEGQFEFYLVLGNSYTIKINQPGFLEYTNEFAISDDDNDAVMTVNFYIEPEEEPELMTLDNLIFGRGSDVISESSFTSLDELVAYLDERPNMVIQLEGHTDFAGNADANMRLSQARVDAVKEYLTGKGVKKGRVLTKAFGGTQPLTTERTDEAKTKNRRVEVRVLRR